MLVSRSHYGRTLFVAVLAAVLSASGTAAGLDAFRDVYVLCSMAAAVPVLAGAYLVLPKLSAPQPART